MYNNKIYIHKYIHIIAYNCDKYKKVVVKCDDIT